MKKIVTREQARDMQDAHDCGLHAKLPREFCPECEGRELRFYPTAKESMQDRILALEPLDFMQPELLDEDRWRWPDVTFTIVDEVGPSGHTTVQVSGTRAALLEWLEEYTDEQADLTDELLKNAKEINS